MPKICAKTLPQVVERLEERVSPLKIACQDFLARIFIALQMR